MVVVTFQFTASAVSWRGRLNEYQTHADGSKRPLREKLGKGMSGSVGSEIAADS